MLKIQFCCSIGSCNSERRQQSIEPQGVECWVQMCLKFPQVVDLTVSAKRHVWLSSLPGLFVVLQDFLQPLNLEPQYAGNVYFCLCKIIPKNSFVILNCTSSWYFSTQVKHMKRLITFRSTSYLHCIASASWSFSAIQVALIALFCQMMPSVALLRLKCCLFIISFIA